MKQIEITVKVNNTLDEVDKILISKGFKLIRKSRVEDEYVCPNDINVNRENILKVLSSSVLIRYLKTQLDVVKDGKNEGSINNTDLLRRISNLEKVIYGKDE